MRKNKDISVKVKTEELKSQLARALADYQNLSKRTEEEKQGWFRYSSGQVLLKFLPVLDNLEVAQKYLKDKGLAIAITDFKNVLNEEGLQEIVPGEKEVFDHNLHEAIEAIPGAEKGRIAELVLPGWKYAEGKVIRFAKVKVFSGKN